MDNKRLGRTLEFIKLVQDKRDKLLAQVCTQFGSFGTIDDPASFAAMTSSWLTPEEARLLSTDFCYPQG